MKKIAIITLTILLTVLLCVSCNTDESVDYLFHNKTAVTGVKLDKESMTLAIGNEQILVATVTPENATDKSVTWSSSNTSVATVDQNGKVTAVAEGEAIITATTKDKGFKATCTVTAKVVFTITFNANDGTETKTYQEVYKGEPSQLIANSFEWSDYGFMYWNTKDDGTGVTYKEKSDVTLYEDINLYAQRGHLITSSTATLDGGKTYTINETQVTNGNRIRINDNTSTVTIYLPADKTLHLSRGLSVIKYSDTQSQTLIIDGDDSGKLDINVNGATGYSAIGGGGSDVNCGNVTIHGGIVYAKANSYAAGIGGGYSFSTSTAGNGGNVEITGGFVTVIGGDDSAGIGGGGIHNGYGSKNGKGGTVHISGGTVITKGGNLHWSGDGIGAGGNSNPSTFGTLTVEDGLTVYGDSSDPPTTPRTDYGTTRYRFMTVK